GADGFDVAWYAPQHLLGLVPDRLDDLLAVGPAFVADRDDRRLVQHDTLAPDVYQRIGRAEVDGHVAGKVTAQESEHGYSARSGGWMLEVRADLPHMRTAAVVRTAIKR